MTAPDDPFSSVVGQSLAKRALLMLAVEPRLGGLLMASPSGTGRRRLVKAFASLLEALKPGGQDAALVRVPLGVGEDRLLGGLSPEPAAAGPRWRYREGLLARADRGVLQVDHINLLPESSLRAIASALDSGRVRVEREGTSTSHPAGFALVGTYDPAEGHPAAIIRARVGLLVDGASAADLDQRRQVLELLAGFEQSKQGGEPAAEPPGFGPAGAAAESIRQARCLLGRVDFGDDDLRRLISAAARLGLEGHRLDLFAMQAARAHAALSGRGRVSEEDLEMAAQLVLWPRAFPVDEEPPPAPALNRSSRSQGRAPNPRSPTPAPEPKTTRCPRMSPPCRSIPSPASFPTRWSASSRLLAPAAVGRGPGRGGFPVIREGPFAPTRGRTAGVPSPWRPPCGRRPPGSPGAGGSQAHPPPAIGIGLRTRGAGRRAGRAAA